MFSCPCGIIPSENCSVHRTIQFKTMVQHAEALGHMVSDYDGWDQRWSHWLAAKASHRITLRK